MNMYSCVHHARDTLNIDGGATEADGGASAPVGPSVATPLHIHKVPLE